MDLLGVEPEVPVVRVFHGQLVVLAVVAAHQHPQSAGGAELPGLRDALDLLFPLALAAQEAGVPHLIADVQKILLRLRLGDLLQNALQVFQVPAGNVHLLPQIFFRRFGLGVALVIFGGVLLGRQQRVQLDGGLGAVFVIVVLAHQLCLPPLHAVEVGGDQVAAGAQPVPILGGGVVLFLQRQLPPQAVPGGGGAADQVRAPLAGPLHPLPGLIKVIQQLTKAPVPLRFRGSAVLGDGQIGKIHRFPLLAEADGCKAVSLDGTDEALQLRPKAVLLLFPKLKDMPVRLPRRPESQLPGNNGRHAEIAVQQKGVQLPLRVGRGKLLPEAHLRFLRHRQAAGGGRRLIVKPRQHLAGCGHIRVHPPQAIDDASLSVQQDQVGPAAHGLQHQRPLSRLAEVIRHIQLQPHQPLQGRLHQIRHPGAHQMLAQEHAEHRRLRWIVPGELRQLDTGRVGAGIQQQPLIAPQQQNHLVPGRLLDLVDSQTQQLGPQLLQDRL